MTRQGGVVWRAAGRRGAVRRGAACCSPAARGTVRSFGMAQQAGAAWPAAAFWRRVHRGAHLQRPVAAQRRGLLRRGGAACSAGGPSLCGLADSLCHAACARPPPSTSLLHLLPPPPPSTSPCGAARPSVVQHACVLWVGRRARALVCSGVAQPGVLSCCALRCSATGRAGVLSCAANRPAVTCGAVWVLRCGTLWGVAAVWVMRGVGGAAPAAEVAPCGSSVRRGTV